MTHSITVSRPPKFVQFIADVVTEHEQGLEHLRIQIEILETSPRPLLRARCVWGVKYCGHMALLKGLS